MTDEEYKEHRRKIIRESQRKRRAQAAKDGKCVICAIRPARQGKKTCEQCCQQVAGYVKRNRKQPKTGHWIDDDDGFGTSCSECGKWYSHSDLTRREVIYCCRCGAKMVESEDKE